LEEKMKKYLLMIISLALSIYSINSSEGFFIQNRDGILIKVDVTSGIKMNTPVKKGPGINESPEKIDINTFEKDYLETITNQVQKDFILQAYNKDIANNAYILKKDYLPEKLDQVIVKNGILGNLNVPEKKYITKYYLYDKSSKFYLLKQNLTDQDKIIIGEQLIPLFVRVIFLQYNKDNEMETGLDLSGAPSPHNFPRTFNPKTQGAIDIQFCWGYKFEDSRDPNINATLEFSINLTNFVMPSLEILVKHNFIINDNPTISPYIGGVLYGGFMDGFPIGLSFLGGTDIFPTYYLDQKTNNYLLAEGRLGAVIFSRTYFDTGSNSDGIWKKIGILAEGGFYFGTGYRWDKK
jgi:hypothetical protein